MSPSIKNPTNFSRGSINDKYFIVEYTDGIETDRSQSYNERRLAERLGRIKEKAHPDKTYRLELLKETSLKY